MNLLDNNVLLPRHMLFFSLVITFIYHLILNLYSRKSHCIENVDYLRMFSNTLSLQHERNTHFVVEQNFMLNNFVKKSKRLTITISQDIRRCSVSYYTATWIFTYFPYSFPIYLFMDLVDALCFSKNVGTISTYWSTTLLSPYLNFELFSSPIHELSNKLL